MLETKSVAQNLNRGAWSALGVLVLTCVHHAYGAYIYKTEWRLHVVFVAILAAVAIRLSASRIRESRGEVERGSAFWTFTLVTLLIPVITVGVFEGGYNHALKDALYFAGSSMELMRRLFPAPTYEMPANVFFEITGVMQLLAGVVAGLNLYHFLKASGNEQRNAESGLCPHPERPGPHVTAMPDRSKILVGGL